MFSTFLSLRSLSASDVFFCPNVPVPNRGKFFPFVSQKLLDQFDFCDFGQRFGTTRCSKCIPYLCLGPFDLRNVV